MEDLDFIRLIGDLQRSSLSEILGIAKSFTDSVDMSSIQGSLSSSYEELKSIIQDSLRQELQELSEWAKDEAVEVAKGAIPPATSVTVPAKALYVKGYLDKEVSRLAQEAKDKTLKKATDISDRVGSVFDSILSEVSKLEQTQYQIFKTGIALYSEAEKQTKILGKEASAKIAEVQGKLQIKKLGSEVYHTTKEELSAIKSEVDSLLCSDLLSMNPDDMILYLKENAMASFRAEIDGAVSYVESGVQFVGSKITFIGEYAALSNVEPMLIELYTNIRDAVKTQSDSLVLFCKDKFNELNSYLDWANQKFPSSDIFNFILTLIGPISAILDFVNGIYYNIQKNREYVSKLANQESANLNDKLKTVNQETENRRNDALEKIREDLGSIDPILADLSKNQLKDYGLDIDGFDPTGSEIIDALNILYGQNIVLQGFIFSSEKESKRQSLIRLIKNLSESEPTRRKNPYRVKVEDLIAANNGVKIDPMCPEVGPISNDTVDDTADDTASSRRLRAILEFDYNIEEFKWLVSPGDTVNAETNLGYFIDISEDGRKIKRFVKSPFSSAHIDRNSYKVVNKDFKRHFVFNINTDSWANLDKDYAEKLSSDIQATIEKIKSHFETGSKIEEFIDLCLFDFFVTEKIARCRGTNSYIKSVKKKLETNKKKHSKKSKSLFDSFKNVKTEDDSKLLDLGNRSYRVKSDYIQLLVDLYRQYKTRKDIPILSRVKFPDTGNKDFSKLTSVHSSRIKAILDILDYQVIDGIEPDNDKLKLQGLLDHFEITRELISPETKYKTYTDKEVLDYLNTLDSNVVHRFVVRKNQGTESNVIEVTDKTTQEIRYLDYSYLDEAREELAQTAYNDAYKRLDLKIESILTKYFDNYSSLDKVQDFTTESLKSDPVISDLMNEPYIISENQFIDLDILGSNYKYHKITGFQSNTNLESDIERIFRGSDEDLDDLVKLTGLQGETPVELSLVKQATTHSPYTYKYWLRHLLIDTALGIPNFVKWFYTPPLFLPVVYLPFVVFKIPILNVICVIGIGIAGMGTFPMILLVNPDNMDRSWLIPLTAALDFAYSSGKLGIDLAKKALNFDVIDKKNQLKSKLAALEQSFKKIEAEERRIMSELESHKDKINATLEEITLEKWNVSRDKASGRGVPNNLLKNPFNKIDE